MEREFTGNLFQTPDFTDREKEEEEPSSSAGPRSPLRWHSDCRALSSTPHCFTAHTKL